jgi:alpha-amylase/alpha-mannosidase (GH57 family)
MAKYVCIHGHFYQPPRENPWLERVEAQEGAAPYHDWNHKITAECYAPNSASRIMDSQNKILAIVNNYALISFNFGPTLLSWLEREAPEVYRSILEAEIKSRSIFSGHGSVIAQAYNHVIMPLANRRDKKTQVIWGIRDFVSRFKRPPEGMWLPETAVDLETLDIMAEEGIAFTLLAPHQASSFRILAGGDWIDVADGNIDTRRPYLCRLPSGKSISIFFYEQQISNGVAFSNLLSSGDDLAKMIIGAFSEDEQEDQLVHLATDGETYGHHHKFGEMALSYCLHNIMEGGQARITNYCEHLARNPPAHEVRIRENTSWSCSHGIERWRDDCGCSVGGVVCQEWRKPLREAMDWLRDSLSPLYEEEASKYLTDPWHARDDYIAVILDRERGNVEAYLKRHSRRELSTEEKTTVLRLLEMQRNGMLMYTSCGWYFDDISGIEAIQVMKYASRAIQLASQVSGIDLEPGYLERLRWANSSRGSIEDGEKIYLRLVKPEVVDLMKVGVHYAISAIFNSHGGEATKVYSYTVKDELLLPMKADRSVLLIGRSNITSDITWESKIASYAVLWLGGNTIYGGARSDMSPQDFDSARSELQNAFKEGEVHRIMATINDRFKAHASAPCSIRDLFKDKQVEIINRILRAPLQKAMDSYTQIFNESHSSMQALADLGAKPPLELQAAAEVIFTKQVIDLLGKEKINLVRLEAAVREIKNLRMELGKELIALEAQRRIEADVDALLKDPNNTEGARSLERLIGLLLEMDLPMNLWRAQNKWYFLVGLLKSGDADKIVSTPNSPWPDSILRISEYLRVRVYWAG